jgi:hypothetical protein
MGTSRKGASHHSVQTIARAMALLATGETVAEVSRQLRVPPQTVSEWKGLLPPEIGGGQINKEIIEDLVGQHIEAALRANLVQLKVFSDPDWLRSQPAGDLAILYGTTCDKGWRILEAAAAAEARQQAQAR